MPHTSCLTYNKPGVPTRTALQAKIDEYVTSLALLRQYIEHDERQILPHLILRMKQTTEIIDLIKPKVNTDDDCSGYEECLGTLDARVRKRIRDEMANINERIIERQGKIRAIEQTLSKERMTLALYPEDGYTITLDVKEWEQKLRRINTYKRNSLRLGTRDTPVMKRGGKHMYSYARFILSGIRMVPSENIYAWLNDRDPVSLAMPDMEVIIDLELCKVWIGYGPHAIRFTLPFYSGAMTPHPHVLTQNSPCLGDFAGGIQDALTNGTLDIAAVLLSQFLSQATQSDSAGATWINAVLSKLPQRYRLQRDSSSGRRELYLPEPTTGKYLRSKVLVDAHGNITWEYAEDNMTQRPLWIDELIQEIPPRVATTHVEYIQVA